MPISTVRRLFVGLVSIYFALPAFSQSVQPDSLQPDTTSRRIAEDERKRLIDPATGTVPYERLEEARRLLTERESQTNASIPNVTWQERGPSNAGGRTYTLLFDPNDPAHKKVWAGNLLSGLWYTNDITDSDAGWTPVSEAWENRTVTALAADPSNPQIMYAGTGDRFNYLSGGGIWKTKNGGTTWVRLTSTIPSGDAPTINRSLESIHRIVVNSSGHIFAATQYGVVKSTDKGISWSYALAPGQLIGVGGKASDYYYDYVTDLEIGTDGILYAAFKLSRIFKSSDASGSSWVEVNLQGVTGSRDDRTELALAPSTSGMGQVLYGVTVAYNVTNYRQDVRWFKKSTDGGTTWSDVVIPTINSTSSGHFTWGNGYYALSLAVHPTDPNTVYAGSYIWCRSTNGGASWNTALSTYAYHHGLYFQPGSNTNVAVASTDGVRWSLDWGSNSVVAPSLLSRNNGYRAGEVGGVALKASPGSSFILANVQPQGIVQLTSAGLSLGQVISPGSVSSDPNSLNVAFIDEDEPGLQLVSSFGTFYRVDNYIRSTVCSLNTYGSIIPADYDSQANTLYTADYNYTTGQALLHKTTNVATTPTNTTVSLGSFLYSSSSFLKLSKDRNALFLCNSNKLYKITNLSQSTPTVTAIDNNAFPQYTSISSVDVGATDNELLVTLSNYGIQSVWYTSDGGVSWTGKDQSNYGLPDIPVRHALFNPQNRKQVFLATELGIWSTTDITATNPGWTFTSSGLGTYRVNQLRYRASDGLLTAATSGRGIWTSDALAIPYTAPTIAISSISSTLLCAGNTFTVSFTQSGPAMGSSNKYEVWISSNTGSFYNKQRIGSNTTSPITATLPSGYNALPYSTDYRIKIVATDPEVESEQSVKLAISDLTSAVVADRLGTNNSYSSTGSMCTGSRATLHSIPRNPGFNNVSADVFQWSLNDADISGATDSTFSAQQPGTYKVTLKQAGCSVVSSSYTLYNTSSPYLTVRSIAIDAPQCDDHLTTIYSDYLGETATYQWKRNGATISGATTYTLATNQTGGYSYQLTDGACSSVSWPKYMQFGKSLAAAIRLSNYRDSTLCNNTLHYMSLDQVYAEQMQANLYTIQWYRDNVPLNSASQNYYTTDKPGAYSVRLSQGSCQARSNTIVLSQGDQIPIAIAYSYKSKSACPGETRTLYAEPAIGIFQWQRDGVDIAGATNNNYQAKLSGSYTVRITRNSCSSVSDPLSLTFSDALQPKVYFYESTPESCNGLNIYAENSSSLSGFTYQWFKDGVAVSGITGSPSTDFSFYARQSGLYSVRVTNGTCTGKSKEIYVRADRLAKPTVSFAYSKQVCLNNSLRLFLSGGIISGSVQWKRNGIIIPGATSTYYYATEGGNYSAMLTYSGCTSESDPIDVTIGEPTTARLSGNVLVSAGKPAQLPVAFTGVAPWSFTLSNGQSVQNTYQNPYMLAVTPASTTTYSLASVTNGCGTGSVAGSSTVSVANGSADLALNMMVNNRTPNVGDVVTYSLMLTNEGQNDATGVQIASRLPTGLIFVEALSPGVTFGDGVVRADAGTVAINGLTRIQFRARVTQPGTFATAAQVTACQTPDLDSQPNSGTGDGEDDAATIDLRTASQSGPLLASANPDQVVLPKLASNQPVADANTADLSLTMRTNALSPKAGDVITVTLQVSNQGGSAASSIEVQTQLPDSWQLASADGLVVNGQTIKGYINQLPPGKSATISLSLRVGSTNNVLRSQISDVAETDPDSTPGNGYDKGEDDEASITVRTR
jgi:uncharacterized repeat protein (TIGR01451 family)